MKTHHGYRGGLRLKVLLAFLFVALVPLAGVVYWYHGTVAQGAYAKAEHDLAATARRVAAALGGFVESEFDRLRLLARSPVLLQYMDASTIEGREALRRDVDWVFRGQDRLDAFREGILMATPEGIVLYDDTRTREGNDLKAWHFFSDAVRFKQATFGGPVHHVGQQLPTFYFCSPVLDRNGDVRAVLVTAWSGAVIQHGISEFGRALGPGSHAMVLSERRVLLADGSLPPITAAERLYRQIRQEIPASKGRLPDHPGIHLVASSTPPRLDWTVIYSTPEANIAEPIRRKNLMILGIFVGIAAVVTVLAYVLSRLVADPIIQISRTAHGVGGGDLSLRVQVTSGDEIGTLADSFNRMVARLQEREEELQSTNEELEASGEELQSANEELRTTIEYLNEMRQKLIEQEKMASLGGLVAGVAHEINTPIGAALTAATYMPPLVGEFMAKMERNELRRSDLTAFVESIDEAIQLTVNNLARAADLVTSFKKISADQTADDCIEFDVSVTIHDVVMSLRHEYKNLPIHVEVECPDPGILTIRNYPGAFVQVLTNLVMNSIRHGLVNAEDGVVSITARREAGAIFVFYSDNGCGMTEEVRSRIFDPFFTTARGTGGTGLGMSIVYNLVTQRMGGTIEVKTAPGEGVLFTIRIPL